MASFPGVAHRSAPVFHILKIQDGGCWRFCVVVVVEETVRRAALILSNRFLVYHLCKERETGIEMQTENRAQSEKHLSNFQLHNSSTQEFNTGKLNFIKFLSQITKY